MKIREKLGRIFFKKGYFSAEPWMWRYIAASAISHQCCLNKINIRSIINIIGSYTVGQHPNRRCCQVGLHSPGWFLNAAHIVRSPFVPENGIQKVTQRVAPRGQPKGLHSEGNPKGYTKRPALACRSTSRNFS